MRPANLIPADERRDRGHGLGAAPVAYAIVAALLIAIGAVTLLVVTDNQISTRKAEVTEVRKEVASAKARASQLSAYTLFHATSEGRSVTISNLAKSRFDWEKVMRQLALVIPPGVRLTNLTGTVKPDVSVGGGESVSLRSGIAGPALAIAGCGKGQESVAGFITALKDIDGVTRVGVQDSTSSDAGGGEGGTTSASANCSPSEARFQMAVAFDAAPIPATLAGSGEAVVEAPPAEEGGEASESGETSEASEAPVESE